MSAAFYMVLLKGVMLAGWQNEVDLKDFLIKINNSLYNKINKQVHITFSAVLLDFNSKTVSFARAGHVPLFHINGTEINVLYPKGIALPFVNNRVLRDLLEVIIIPMTRGDCLILLTSGLIEALGNYSISEGMEKLKALVNNDENLDIEK